MPITVAFTITAALAMIGLTYIERELWLNFAAVRDGKENGMSAETTWMVLVLISIIWLTNAMLLIAGAGLLLKLRWLGYLFALIPVVKLAGTLLALRSLRQQSRIFHERK